MPARSQRPLINRLLALEPLTVPTVRFGDFIFTSLDDALRAVNVTITLADLDRAMIAHGIDITGRTLWRMREDVLNETA